MAALLEVAGIGKRFAPSSPGVEAPWVIRDLSFAIGAGEFVTMLGPSGAGKSTILNLIAQVDPPTEGRVLLSGQEVYGPARTTLRPGLDRRVGYVTQDDNLLPWRTLGSLRRWASRSAGSPALRCRYCWAVRAG